MKKTLFILFVSLFIFACTKDNNIEPTPGPIPDPVLHELEITVNFIIPDDVKLYGGNDMWLLDSNKELIVGNFQSDFPVTKIVLTGDVVKDNLNKKVYLRFDFCKEIGFIFFSYDVVKSFTMKSGELELSFSISSEKESESYIDP
jgi:hypothetical protein